VGDGSSSAVRLVVRHRDGGPDLGGEPRVAAEPAAAQLARETGVCAALSVRV